MSTAFADSKRQENFKSVNEKLQTAKPKTAESVSASDINFSIANLSTFLFGDRLDRSFNRLPFTYGNSFSTTAAPFSTYNSTPAPVAFGNSYASNIFSNVAAVPSFGKSYPVSTIGSYNPQPFFTGASASSTPAPLFDGVLASSTPAALIGSSTVAPILADAPLSAAPISGAIVSDAGLGFSSTPAPALLAGTTPFVSSTPEPVLLNRSPAFSTAYGAHYTSNVPSFSYGATFAKNDAYNAQFIPAVSVASVPAPHREITINKEVPVPYYVQVEKRIPYPVLVHVPHPYPVTVERHVPYAIRVNVDRPIHVPRPYPVEVEKRVPYPVEKPVPYEVKVPVDRPYPVHVPVEKPVPYAVERPVPYPVRINIDRPYPVEKPVPYPIAIAKPVPYPVEKAVPYPVEKAVPYPVEKRVPYPVKYEVPVNVPVPVEVKVPVTVDRPVPYPVEKKVPYPVQVPVEVRIPVPVQNQVQRFATVHYFQSGPAAIGYDSAALIGQSGYKTYGSGLGLASIPDSAIYGSSASPLNFYGSTTSPLNFYGSTPAPTAANVFTSNAISAISSYNSNAFNAYTSNSFPAVNSYSSTASPAEFIGSNFAQQGFDSSQFGLDQQVFYGSSTPAPYNSFSGNTASIDAASLARSSNFESTSENAVSVEHSTVSTVTPAAEENLDVEKK